MDFYDEEIEINEEDSFDDFNGLELVENNHQEDEFAQLFLDGALSDEMSEIEREVQMELYAEELEEADETYRDAA